MAGGELRRSIFGYALCLRSMRSDPIRRVCCGQELGKKEAGTMAGANATSAKGPHTGGLQGDQSRPGGIVAGKGGFRWIVIFLLFYITVANYIDRSAIAYAIGGIKTALGLG